jgi:hypothetical protein
MHPRVAEATRHRETSGDNTHTSDAERLHKDRLLVRSSQWRWEFCIGCPKWIYCKNKNKYSPHDFPPLDSSIIFPFGDFFKGNKLHISHLNGCQTAWNVNNMTFDKQNASWVAIMHLNARYSAPPLLVRTNQFIEHMCSPYKLKKAMQR